MGYFAFILHPLQISDLYREYKFAKYLPSFVMESIIKKMKPRVLSHIKGVRSITGTKAEGWFIVCPLSSKMILNLDVDFVINKIVEAGRVAQDMGAGIVGLGAFTAVVGDAGETIAKNLDIAVTTGNSYTIATAIEGAKEAAKRMDIELSKSLGAVIGATGSIGKVCAQLLAKEMPHILLISRNMEKLENLKGEIENSSSARVEISAQINPVIRNADIIITVTSAIDSVINANDLKPGAVVCDVARPRDVSKEVVKLRNDVLVIEGGVIDVPGVVDFGFDFGFPPKTAYACMAETMILALEGRYESFTLGRNITLEQVEEITALAKKHGFKLSGFRSFEREVTQEEIDRIKERATKRG